MPEEIDYQALVEKLQKELEAARLTIVKMRHSRNLLERLDGDAIRKFVQQNYLVIVVGFFLLEFIYKIARDYLAKRKGSK